MSLWGGKLKFAKWNKVIFAYFPNLERNLLPFHSTFKRVFYLSLESITKNTSLPCYLTLDLENKSYLFRVHGTVGSDQPQSNKDIWRTYMKIYEGKKK